jgi:hypothetical protein
MQELHIHILRVGFKLFATFLSQQKIQKARGQNSHVCEDNETFLKGRKKGWPLKGRAKVSLTAIRDTANMS